MIGKRKEKSLEKAGPSIAERFTSKIINEFKTTGSVVEFNDKQKRLANHLFVHIDNSLKKLEAKRLETQPRKKEITWATINMNKLAIDAVHRIELGLDALIPNHISVIPYFNSRMGLYDLDLRIGYAGKSYYRQSVAVEKPVEVVIELVHEADEFEVFKKGEGRDVETYSLVITKPFNRGEVIGGFGYIRYQDPTKNKVVLVTDEDFKKAESAAQSQTFWESHPENMKMKTVVNRTMDHIPMDPNKLGKITMKDNVDIVQEPVNDNPPPDDVVDVEPEMTDEEKAEIEAAERAMVEK